MNSVETLENELQLNKVSLNRNAEKSVVMSELLYAIKIKKHENEMSSYGVVFSDKSDIPNHKIIPTNDLKLARSLSDGISSFVLYKNSSLIGVVIIPFIINSELDLVRLKKTYNGLIIQREIGGIVKVLQENEIVIHEHRIWQIKPSVTSVVDKIHRCVPKINDEILLNILNFSFHQLSPQNIGASIIWCLEEPSENEFNKMIPSRDLADLNISINDSSLLELLKHILSGTDGATLVDPDGNILGTEAHLVYSDQSKKLINQTKGTRHTSARRFSYDVAKVLAFTISEDGPVTVFSDGVDIVNLDIFSAEDASIRIRRDAHEAGTDAATQANFDVVQCGNCHKKIEIEELVIYGWKSNESTTCPVCNNEVYTSRCYQLEAYVVKDL